VSFPLCVLCVCVCVCVFCSVLACLLSSHATIFSHIKSLTVADDIVTVIGVIDYFEGKDDWEDGCDYKGRLVIQELAIFKVEGNKIKQVLYRSVSLCDCVVRKLSQSSLSRLSLAALIQRSHENRVAVGRRNQLLNEAIIKMCYLTPLL
jgi:hypothetical protein